MNFLLIIALLCPEPAWRNWSETKWTDADSKFCQSVEQYQCPSDYPCLEFCIKTDYGWQLVCTWDDETKKRMGKAGS